MSGGVLSSASNDDGGGFYAMREELQKGGINRCGSGTAG